MPPASVRTNVVLPRPLKDLEIIRGPCSLHPRRTSLACGHRVNHSGPPHAFAFFLNFTSPRRHQLFASHRRCLEDIGGTVRRSDRCDLASRPSTFHLFGTQVAKCKAISGLKRRFPSCLSLAQP